MSDFTFQAGPIQKYAEWCEGAAKQQIKGAVVMTMNSLAFKARDHMTWNIIQTMMIRNHAFVRGSFAVEKATGSTLTAYAGSIIRPRFTGWAEQEGAPNKRKRAASIAARSGSFGNQVAPKMRFKSANKFTKPEQFEGRSDNQRFAIMMRILATRPGNKYFLLSKNHTSSRSGHVLTPGLYLFKGKKIARIQSLDVKPPKKNEWMQGAIRRLNTSNALLSDWEANLDRVLNGPR